MAIVHCYVSSPEGSQAAPPTTTPSLSRNASPAGAWHAFAPLTSFDPAIFWPRMAQGGMSRPVMFLDGLWRSDYTINIGMLIMNLIWLVIWNICYFP